jgi:hypothetical protein
MMVIKVVSVVEIAASLGTFKKLLFKRIKLMLDKMANAIATMNFQFSNTPMSKK